MRRRICAIAIGNLALFAALAVPIAVPARLVIVASGGHGSYRVTATDATQSSAEGRGPIFMPYIVTHTGPELAATCVAYRTLANVPPKSYPDLLVAAQVAWNQLAGLPRCDRQAASGAVIVSAWRAFVSTRLPQPSASISPRLGVVNLPLAIGVSGTTSASATVASPAGPLTITATGILTVESASGAEVAHQVTPTSVGSFRVVPVETWSGTYALGATTGALPEIRVVGTAVSVPVIALTTNLGGVS